MNEMRTIMRMQLYYFCTARIRIAQLSASKIYQVMILCRQYQGHSTKNNRYDDGTDLKDGPLQRFKGKKCHSIDFLMLVRDLKCTVRCSHHLISIHLSIYLVFWCSHLSSDMDNK